MRDLGHFTGRYMAVVVTNDGESAIGFFGSVPTREDVVTLLDEIAHRPEYLGDCLVVIIDAEDLRVADTFREVCARC